MPLSVRKQLVREVERLLSEVEVRGLHEDTISKIHGLGAKRMCKKMPGAELLSLRAALTHALTHNRTIKLRKGG